MFTTKTGPTCPRCGSLVIPGGCVNCRADQGGTMKTYSMGFDPGKGDRAALVVMRHEADGSVTVVCEVLGEQASQLHAAIEDRDREWVEAAATVIKDARGECNDNELMRRIRALIPKEAP